MASLSLKDIKVKKSLQRISEPIKFDLIFDCHREIKDDVEFTVIYNGDAETEEYDQVLCNELVGPIPKGKVGFSLETVPPVVDKIPVEQLFGVTSVIIIGKYHEQQFIRIGFFVNVEYPGIPNSELTFYEEGEEESDLERISEESSATEEEENIPDLVADEKENNVEEERGDNLAEIIEEIKTANEETKNSNLQIQSEISNMNEEVIEKMKEEKLVSDEKNLNPEISGEVEESNLKDILTENISSKEESKTEEISNENRIFINSHVLDKNLIEIELVEPPLKTVFTIKWAENDESICDSSFYEESVHTEENEYQIDENSDKGLEENLSKESYHSSEIQSEESKNTNRVSIESKESTKTEKNKSKNQNRNQKSTKRHKKK